MLTRRHLRIKVMQCIYALIQSKEDSLQKQQKFLKVSIENTFVLYLLLVSLLKEIHARAIKIKEHDSAKYIASDPSPFPDPSRFVNNALMQHISQNARLAEAWKKRKLDDWDLHADYVKIIYKDLVSSELYQKYMTQPETSFTADRDFVIELFKTVIAPNEKIYDYFEDTKLTWVDDYPVVNTFMVKHLRKVKPQAADHFLIPSLLKDEEDMAFANDLLTKTLLKDKALEEEILGKTPNWDKDRIAEIDAILLKMAICELLHFPSIPERVTINEYLEIAKEYSTPKSSIFINGILDKLVREYRESGKLKKAGRGLL